MALGNASMNVLFHVALSWCIATWSWMSTICKCFQIVLLDQHALQHWCVIMTNKIWRIWREFRMSRSLFFLLLELGYKSHDNVTIKVICTNQQDSIFFCVVKQIRIKDVLYAEDASEVALPLRWDKVFYLFSLYLNIITDCCQKDIYE